jgi:hypothetical protein
MLRGACLVVALAALSSGCNQGKCGAGTLRYGDECVVADPFDKTPPNLSIDPPLYTRQVGTVTITSDEPATIYYTLDGSPTTTDSASASDEAVIPSVPDNTILRTFAIDLAGNQSPEVIRIWVVDRDGPPPPIGFTLAIGADQATRTLTWQMPPDSRPGGVLVARVDKRIDAAPVSGQTYNVGDQIGTSATVVAVTGPDANGTFTETMPLGIGLAYYVAWAYDDLHNYGPPAGDFAVTPLPTQNAVVTVNASTQTVAVPTKPPNLTLSGTAVLNGTTLTVKLSATNDTARPLYALKGSLTSTLPGGVTWTDSAGTWNNNQYVAYGAVLMPGTTVAETLTFAGASTSTNLSLSLAFATNPVLATAEFTFGTDPAGAIVDGEAGTDALDLSQGVNGDSNGGDGTQTGAFTPDGRLVLGSRVSGTLMLFDLANGSRITTNTLREQKAYVPHLVADKSGTTIYALVANGHPYHINRNGSTGTSSQLVRVDAGTLTEYGPRIDLGSILDRSIDISPDGKTLIVCTGSQTVGILVVDLTTWQLRTPLIPKFRPQVARFTPDGHGVAVIGEKIQIFDLHGEGGPELATPGTNGKVRSAAFSSPTMLWIGRRNEVVAIDLSTQNTLEFTQPLGAIVEFIGGKLYVKASGGIQRWDAAGNVEVTLPGFGRPSGHWLGRSPY